MTPANQKAVATPKRLPVDELESILCAHSAFVSHVRGGRRALLKSYDLSGINLSNRVLSDADLSGTILNGAALRFAEFVGANLYCCDMRGADASYANFSHADMRGAILSGCNLAHAKLNCADCRPGRMLQSSATGLQDVFGQTAASASFSQSLLSDVDFENAKLEGADFTGAIIQSSNFKGAVLKNAKFQDAVLSGIDLADLQLPEAALKSCIVTTPERSSADFEHLMEKMQLHQRWISSNARDGAAAVFDGEDLRPLSALIGSCQLTAISAKGAVAVMMNFSRCELQGANFENADLRGANFEKADLRGVRFQNARLNHARFSGADLRPLVLPSGEHLACDFSGAEMIKEQLDTAIRA